MPANPSLPVLSTKGEKMNFTNENILHKIGENLEYIQFRRLLEYQDILTHAYTLKHETINFGPNLTKETIKTNYQTLCHEFKLDEKNIVRPNQQHTDTVKILNHKVTSELEYNPSYLEKTDGLITNQKDIILSTTNADCILFLLFDPTHKVIADVHSGWRGSLQEIVIKTVKQMQKTYQSNPEDIICCICPSIRKCHFEVDDDVKDLFYHKFKYLPNIDQIIERKNSKYHIDTILLNKTLLLNLGLKEENIIDSNICSVCHSNQINSYRIDKENYKLSTAIISLK